MAGFIIKPVTPCKNIYQLIFANGLMVEKSPKKKREAAIKNTAPLFICTQRAIGSTMYLIVSCPKVFLHNAHWAADSTVE